MELLECWGKISNMYIDNQENKKKQLLISEKANHASSEKVIRTQFS